MKINLQEYSKIQKCKNVALKIVLFFIENRERENLHAIIVTQNMSVENKLFLIIVKILIEFIFIIFDFH